jgi:outer membrane receptor protein involved in Fe transport
MKKVLPVCALLLSAIGLLRADDQPLMASSGTVVESTAAVVQSTDTVIQSSIPVVVSTAPNRGVTEPNRDIFVTLTRGAFEKAALPTSADIVTPNEFRTFNAQNAGEALSHATSLQPLPIGQHGSALLAGIRGSTPGETLVLIDGRPTEGASLGASDLSEIPVENIERIEILRGGASALYGPNAVGGVVNVITKRATYSGQPISHVGFQTATYGRQAYRLDFGSRYGPVDYFFFANQQWESGFRDNSDARSHNIGGNAGFSMGKAGKLLFDVSAYHINAGIPNTACGPLDPFCASAPATYLTPNQFNNHDEKLASTPNARQSTDSNFVRASYILPLPKESLMTLRLFGSQREVDFEDPASPNPANVASLDRQEQSKGGEAQFNLPLGLTVGGTFLHDREDHHDRLASANSFLQWTENYGVFAQEEFHWETLTLIPSGRYDHNSRAGEFKSPRVALIEDAMPWLRFSGSAARSFRTPSLDELFLASPLFSGNAALRPETAWTYDAGFDLHADSTSFKATYFRTNLHDLIQPAPITFNSVANVGTARRQGAEVQLRHVLNEFFQHTANYTYLESLGMPTGSDHLVPLSLSPRHTANYVASIFPRRRWRFDATVRYEDSRYTGHDQTGTKLGSQVIFDARIAFQLRQLEIFTGVQDIGDKKYEEVPGFPLPGRTAYFGLRLLLWG